MSLEKRGSFSLASELPDREKVHVVFAHGYGLNVETDRRQQRIARQLAENGGVIPVMPEMSDTIDDDIIVEGTIPDKVERLRRVVEALPGKVILALHSQGSIPGFELVAGDLDNQLGVDHTFVMGPVIDLEGEAA